MRMPQSASGPDTSGATGSDGGPGGTGAGPIAAGISTGVPTANGGSGNGGPASGAGFDGAGFDGTGFDGTGASAPAAEPGASGSGSGSPDRGLADWFAGTWPSRLIIAFRSGQIRRALSPANLRTVLRPPTSGELARLALNAGALARRHWLATILLAIGLVLRVLTQLAYSPAIIYIDSLKYIYNAWPGADPIAYKVPLDLILGVGDLSTVTLVQHVVGLATGAMIYAVVIRRGAPRWLAALAMAPVLLDAYQLQAEQMIMPDIWFEALIVAALAVMLWKPVPTTRLIVIGAVLLGLSVGLRQIGEILVLPVVVFALVAGGGWRQAAWRAAAGVLAFGMAVMAYMAGSGILAGRYYISRSSTSLTYGRMAAVADCATLKLPPVEQPLCPSPAQQAMGPDWLDHGNSGTLKQYQAAYARSGSPAGSFGTLESKFNTAVETQQPMRVIAAITRDAVKLFAVTRQTMPGDTPIWRWQFQTSFPTYPPYVTLSKGQLTFSYSRSTSPTGQPLAPNPQPMGLTLGGPPRVNVPIASFLRSYQLGGGYTPGPLYLLFLLTGLAGSVLLLARRRLTPGARQLAQATLLAYACGVLVLGASDVFEFTWRYQLPGIVTLPPAGALGIAALIAFARRNRHGGETGPRPERIPELAKPLS